jgi:hypothetical protein
VCVCVCLKQNENKSTSMEELHGKGQSSKVACSAGGTDKDSEEAHLVGKQPGEEGWGHVEMCGPLFSCNGKV